MPSNHPFVPVPLQCYQLSLSSVCPGDDTILSMGYKAVQWNVNCSNLSFLLHSKSWYNNSLSLFRRSNKSRWKILILVTSSLFWREFQALII